MRNAIRAIDAWAGMLAAWMENAAAEMNQKTAEIPQRDYFRGYEDGFNDSREVSRG